MHNPEQRPESSGDNSPYDEATDGFQVPTAVVGILRRMRHTYPVFFAILFLFILLWAGVYLCVDPEYTAEATIGPPNPSPTSALLSTGGNGSVSFAKKLMGGGSSGGNDTFQEYQNLLQSPRLAVELAARDGFLQVIFDNQWDAEKKAWKPHGMLRNIMTSVKQFLKRPVSENPDATVLYMFLQKHLSASQAGSRFALASMDSGYIDASLHYKNREEAEKILGIILHRADEIIRQEQMRDVEARIAYIKNELPNIQQTEQRDSLISVLTNQEELKVMLVADQRFASILISPPYASPIPSSPTGPLRAAIVSMFLSITIWILLLLLEIRVASVRNLLLHFTTRSGQSNTHV
jgi:hypothetical protein